MRENLYHLLNFLPGTKRFEMLPRQERDAQALVVSGKLRINADSERNYVRHGERTYTMRELTDKALWPATHRAIARQVAPAEGERGIAEVTARLMRDLRKARGVSAEKEIRVARVLVQAAHPAVIGLLLRSGTEVFVSYSHNVADLMEVQDWANLGTASGLQATELSGTAVYVSAGGDPFFEGEQKTYTTDGFPALARMVVIAGQELGHFADLRRRSDGQVIGRHSLDSNHRQQRADPVALAAWRADGQQVAQLRAGYAAAGLARLQATERSVAFYHVRLRYTPPWFFHQLRRGLAWLRFTQACKARGIDQRFRLLPAHRHGEAVALYLDDMEVNLTPAAEVYRHADPLVEESILVLEAVARVPQQVHKWGHAGVQKAWPGLYRFYFGTVIPACEAVLGETTTMQEFTLFQKLMIRLRRRFRARPGYYP